MVQIPQYTQQEGLAAPSRDIPNVVQPTDGGIGQAIQGLGNTLSNLYQVAKDRRDKMDAFNTRVTMDTFQEQAGQTLTEMERNTPGDGQGLHDGFMKWYSENTQKVLATITNPELRAQTEAVLNQSGAAHWSNQAANSEYKISNTYTVDQLTTAGEKAKLGIAQNPGSYDGYVADMETRIKHAPNLTADQRQKMLDELHTEAPKFMAAGVQQSDPETYRYMMGLGTADERKAFLTRRVIQAESGFDPSAESGKGASGIMQVMPDTGGVEVARKLGDKAYLAMNTEQRKEFLKNPQNGMRYGQTYLGMMVDRYHGDVEAALVAYNAGPGNADKWLANGRDYKALPKPGETLPYVQKVLGNMGPAKYVSGSVADPSSTPAPGNKRMPIVTGTQGGRQPLQMQGVKPELLKNFELLQGDFGKQIPIVSGFRDVKRNMAAGGANKSQHIEGNAIDLDVSGLSKQERIQLIQQASARGFTGIGIYKNSIHLDMRAGAPVAWGPSHHAASVPAWAFHAAAQHRQGAYGKGAPIQTADASGTGGMPASDAGPQYADGVPGGSGGVSRSGFVSPIFEGMGAGDYLKMQHEAATGYAAAEQTQLAQSTADQILSGSGATADAAGDRKAAYTALDAIGDAELKKDVAPLIESHFNRWDKVNEDQAKQRFDKTWNDVDAAVAAGKTDVANALVIQAGLPPDETEKLRARIAKGPVQNDDQRLVQSLDAMRFSNPKQFMEIDFRKVGDLTNGSLKSYQELQAKMKEDAQKATSDQAKAMDGLMKDQAAAATSRANQVNETFSKASPLVDRYFLETGIPTDAKKMTPADAEHANFVRSTVAKELEIQQMASKTPLTITQIQDTVDAVMKTYPRNGPAPAATWYNPMTWGSSDADVNLNEVLTAYGDAGLDPDQMAAAIRKKGMQVNAQTMQQMLDTFNASKGAQ